MYTLQRKLLWSVTSPHVGVKRFTYFPSRSSDGTYLLASTELVLIHCDRDSSKADLKKLSMWLVGDRLTISFAKFRDLRSDKSKGVKLFMLADIARILTFCSDPNSDRYRFAQPYASSNMATFGVYSFVGKWKDDFVEKAWHQQYGTEWFQPLPVGYFSHLLHSEWIFDR